MEDLIKREDAIEKICDIYRLMSLFSGGSDRRDEWIDKATYALKDVPSVESSIVQCKDCEYKVHCHQTVSHTKIHEDFKEYWSEPIEWCSRAKMKGAE